MAGEGLACVRGDRLLFEGLDLHLAAGDAALVTGPNGAGKSSLLRLLAGLLQPAAGTIRCEGRIGLAAEAPALDQGRTLEQALAFWAELDGQHPVLPRHGEVAAKLTVGAAAESSLITSPSDAFGATSPWRGRNYDITPALDAMALAPLAQVPVRMLSTGQRKRATIARVIASGAGVWLLDEPGNGLDADSLTRLAAATAVHRAAGGIVVAATHQPLGLTGAIEVRL